jgi:hypothetical protein
VSVLHVYIYRYKMFIYCLFACCYCLCQQLKLCNEGLVSDMSKLQHIHEPAILYNLSRRFLQRHEYYTYAGRNVLVSMNPMTWEYPDVKIEDYFSCSVSTCAPHPYVFTGTHADCVERICYDAVVVCLLLRINMFLDSFCLSRRGLSMRLYFDPFPS